MEQFNFWLQLLIQILSGIAILVPLMVKLVRVVQIAAKEKNWSQVLKLVMNLMEEAEQKYTDGATRKEWVVSELEAVSKTLNYDIDWDVISDMIDKICAASKKINKG